MIPAKHINGRRAAKSFTPQSILVYGGIIISGLLLLLSWKHLARSRSASVFEDKSLNVSSGTFSEAPLFNVLTACGIAGGEAYKISAALKKNLDPRELQEGDEYTVVFSTSGEFRYITLSHWLRHYSVFISSGKYVSSVRDIPLNSSRKSNSGTIENSLWESMSAAGFPPQFILEFADIFAWNIDFLTEARNGDRYAVIWQESSTPEGVVAHSRILGAVYDGQETGRRTGILFKNDYFTENGESLKKLFLRAPLNYRRISSYFAKRRFHPVLRYFRPHLGIDYAAPSGTPVSSVADGRVTFAGWKGGFGRYVEIRHNSAYTTSYGHLSRFSNGIRRGAGVNQGKVIGYVGASGLATGPHLDFRVKENGKFVNFLKIKSRSAGSLARSSLAEFRKAVEGVISELGKIQHSR